ncbi:MAG: GntR family transcriptional regulator [Deltaproteobacteria bacterium]|nr:GntR family transcriptional regulator [Deltaproteobacteria bacterium]
MDKLRVFDSEIEKPLTLRERIVEFVKDSIIKGKLHPGERVPEHSISESFGISRTPIREAFRQLESEGFITVVPRKGAVVSSISASDVKDFYAIKSLLEGYAAKKACLKLSEKDIKKLQDLNRQMVKCAEKNDVKGFFRLDNQFHEIFLRLCGNNKLCDMSHQVVRQFERLRVMALSLPGRMEASTKQHDAIIAAFEKKDENEAEKLVMKNAEFSAEILVRELSKEKDSDGTGKQPGSGREAGKNDRI